MARNGQKKISAKGFRCENCGRKYSEEELEPIKDLFQRVAPGEAFPAGQCPHSHCGALCHPIPAKAALKNKYFPVQIGGA